MAAARAASTGALLLLPGALTVYLAFSEGGFFPGTQAFVTVVLLVLLLARVALGEAPVAGFSRPIAIAAAPLALYALWTLVSAGSSDSLARSLIEFDRVLLYLAALLLFGSLARRSEQMRVMLWGVALGFAVVAGAALITRLLPETWPTDPNLQNDRLSYPLGYWNALGVLSALGVVLCLHLASRVREPPPARVLGAAAVPMLATTVLFTFSRGAIVAGVIGVVAYVLLGRPRALLSGLLATAPTTVIAAATAYHAEALATPTPTTPAAIAQGEDVALAVALCTLGAALLRVTMLPLDARLERIRVDERTRRRLLRPLAAASVVAAVLVAIALGVPRTLDRQYERFVQGDQAEFTGDFRQRLADPASPARQRQWRVAMRQFEGSELAGRGAATYELAWERERPDPSTVVDAHSLYIETLGELGLVGLVLLAATLVAILAGFAHRARRGPRPLYAALFAAGLAWAAHAGIDWDWEMPAVTLWLFALGGAALARSRREGGPASALPPLTRAALGLAILAVMTVPTLIAVSRGRLSDSAEAFAREDCDAAVRSAESSIAALDSWAEPYEILAYCDIRAGMPRRGVERMKEAIDRDPGNWNYHYSLAIARGAAGLDPRPAARRALRLNPLDPLARDAVRRFRTGDRRVWIQRARDVASSFRAL